jgi:hypothetical protein
LTGNPIGRDQGRRQGANSLPAGRSNGEPVPKRLSRQSHEVRGQLGEPSVVGEQVWRRSDSPEAAGVHRRRYKSIWPTTTPPVSFGSAVIKHCRWSNAPLRVRRDRRCLWELTLANTENVPTSAHAIPRRSRSLPHLRVSPLEKEARPTLGASSNVNISLALIGHPHFHRA